MIKLSKFWIRLAVVLFLFSLAWIRTDGFRSFAVTFFSDGHSDGEKLAVSSEVAQILKQKFYYLGKGRQSFVFVSEDHQYVIKFFNFHHFYYPLQLKLAFLKDKSWRLDAACRSYQLAFDRLKNETALVYVHLQERKILDQPLCVINPVGIAIHIDLNQTYFVVQRKVEPFFAHLTDLAGQGKLTAGLDSFLQTVAKRLESGILDDDLDVAKNYGFIQEKAVNFDAGRFSLVENISQELFEKELYKSSKKLSLWLQLHYPQEELYLKRGLRGLVQERF